MWSRKNRAPMRPTRPSPAAISASISPAASRTCPSAPDCATGCVEQLEQQRQLASVLPNSHGRRRAVSTYHQRVRDVHSPRAVRPAVWQAAHVTAKHDPAAYVPGTSSLGPSPVATVLAESRRLLTLTLTLKKTSRHVFLNTVPERAENSLFGSGLAFFKFHNLA